MARPAVVSAALFLALTATRLDAQADSGTFTLFKFAQAIGAEHYQVIHRSDGVIVADSFSFTDRGSTVPLRTTLRTESNGDPIALQIRGRISRQSSIDEAVTLTADSAVIRIDSVSHAIARPAAAFTIAGYAPVVVQQALLRYWVAHQRPTTLSILPTGQVEISDRGADTVIINQHPVMLERYSIAGLIWGRETIWLDAEGQAAALVSIDAEFDHFEAARVGYEGSLALFLARAAADAGAALAELARQTQPASQGAFALVGATLIDGRGGPAVPNATIVVKNGRIRAAGAGVKVPKGYAVVDAHGQSVLPGLWDMHAHYEQVEWGPIYLAAGVTTVRDVGNEFDFITAVRDGIRSGKGIGPRLLLAGVVDGNSTFALGIERVGTAEQAVAEVRKYHAAGFQQMKIYSSMDSDMVKAVSREAHRLGMTVTGHIPEGMNGYDGVNAGMDQINHVQYIRRMMLLPRPAGADPKSPPPPFDLNGPDAQKALAFLAAHHTVVDPTVALYEWILHPADRPVSTFEPGVLKVAPELQGALVHSGVAAADSAGAQARFHEFLAIVGALHKAGVTVVAGTDQSVPGHSLHRELELYVQAGFTPMEAIQAATIVPARVMHLDKEVGTVIKGMRADLVVVDGNPLTNFADLRQVRLVVSDGRRYEPGPLWQSVGFEP
jgi:cytosine/adenosine deaminase-related metal-dependent hydrolase